MGSALRSLTLTQARRAWLVRQQLDPATRPATEAADAVDLAQRIGAVGWVPAAVGASAYLSLLARGAISRRSTLDAAVFDRQEVALVPGPRGYLWLVPQTEAPLARAFAVAEHAAREARIASAIPLMARELHEARDALRALLDRPRSPAELRAKLPPAVLRSLGPVGRRVGCATVVGLVLHGMWTQGELQRLPAEGRLDGEGVVYGIDPRPRVVPNAADAVDVVAARWLAAHAPTTARAFAAAFGIALGRAQSALKPLRVAEWTLDGLDETFVTPADFEPPPEAPSDEAEALVSFLPFRDPLTDVRPTLAGLADEAVGRAALLKQLGPGPVVLVDGEVVALWAYDPTGLRLVVRPLGAVSASLAERIERAAVPVAAFVAAELRPPVLHTTARARLPSRVSAELGAEL